MKKITLAFLTSIFVCFIYAQEFMPIPNDTTSHWRIFGSQLIDLNCGKHYWDWHYIKGEKIVGNKSYHKIYSKGHWSYYAIPPYGTCTGSGETLDVYEGAIRTENDTIYFIPKYQNYPEMLFDYTLEVGDTVPPSIYLIQDYPTVTTVESIDSVITDSGSYLRRWHFQNILMVDYHWFIEGIGTKKGIFYPFSDGGEHTREFICYSENYLPFYPAGTGCDPTVIVHETETENNGFIFYPNPTNGELHFEILNEQIEPIKVEIRCLTGQLITSEKVGSNMSQTINCTTIRKGIYLAVIYFSNGETKTQKLVLSN